MKASTQRRIVVTAAIGAAGVIAIFGAIGGIKTFQMLAISKAFAMQVVAPERVNAVGIEEQRWESHLTSIGSVEARQGTDVSVEVDGVVRSIAFEAGAIVAAGDVLVTLDDEVEQAQLRSAEAAAELARLNLERARRLVAQNAVARSDFDHTEASWKQAAAQVDNIRAVIAKKVIRAPFAGKVGIRRVSVGDFLAKGAQIVALQSVDPVYVEFSVPQRRLAELRPGLPVTVTADAYAGELFQGEITALEPYVDAATRNVRVQATFANRRGALTPGMYVAVDVELGVAAAVNVIPATAVVHGRDHDSVFVIEPGAADELVLRRERVRLGERRGDFVVVEEGPAAGASVVATGVFKLRDGMPVIIDNTLAPQFVLAPAPGNG